MSEHTSIEVIRLAGELDIGRRTELRESLAIGGSARAVLLDLAEVTYADSTALGELLDFKARADERKIPVALVVTSPQFDRLIRYAGLHEVFDVHSDVGAALSELDRKS